MRRAQQVALKSVQLKLQKLKRKKKEQILKQKIPLIDCTTALSQSGPDRTPEPGGGLGPLCHRAVVIGWCVSAAPLCDRAVDS